MNPILAGVWMMSVCSMFTINASTITGKRACLHEERIGYYPTARDVGELVYPQLTQEQKDGARFIQITKWKIVTNPNWPDNDPRHYELVPDTEAWISTFEGILPTVNSIPTP